MNRSMILYFVFACLCNILTGCFIEEPETDIFISICNMSENDVYVNVLEFRNDEEIHLIEPHQTIKIPITVTVGTNTGFDIKDIKVHIRYYSKWNPDVSDGEQISQLIPDYYGVYNYDYLIQNHYIIYCPNL